MRKAFVAVLATCVLVGTAAAQAPQGDQPQPNQPSQREGGQQGQQGKQGQRGQPTEVMAERMSMTATVEKVDKKKRQLMLTDDQGNKFKVEVPKEAMKNLESLKPGDKITADYYSSVALKLQKGEKGAPGAEETMMERKAAKLPGGLVAKKVSATVEVEKVDTSANTITVKGPTGESDTIKVTDPLLQSKLANIKPGDRIQASYAEAIAIRVTPSTQQSSNQPSPGQPPSGQSPSEQAPPSGQQSRR